MAFAGFPGALYNVRGSFNEYFRVQLTAAGLPSWLPAAVVNYDHPNQPLTCPSFSVAHLGTVAQEIAQGRHLDPGWRGARQVGMVEVSVWESQSRASGYVERNLRQMADLAVRVFATGAVVPILDVYGDGAAPTANGTILRVGPLTEEPEAADPNPDVRRVRLMGRYEWLQRVTAG